MWWPRCSARSCKVIFSEQTSHLIIHLHLRCPTPFAIPHSLTSPFVHHLDRSFIRAQHLFRWLRLLGCERRSGSSQGHAQCRLESFVTQAHCRADFTIVASDTFLTSLPAPLTPRASGVHRWASEKRYTRHSVSTRPPLFHISVASTEERRLRESAGTLVQSAYILKGCELFPASLLTALKLPLEWPR